MQHRRLLLTAGLCALAPVRASAQTIKGQLTALMLQVHVPAASVALIRDGEVAESCAVGADIEALFQAASISKVVTGQVILRLMERGRLSLDAPVKQLANRFSAPVTPRLLLCHRAGTNVPGFPGYAAGSTLPDLGQILDGAPPANTPAVKVEWPPGESFRYSGGGTMVLQRVAIEAAGEPFAALASELVLGPSRMRRSNFAQPPVDTDIVVAHDSDGKPLPGRFHLYPELAAAGLWSTAGDLARLALGIAAGPFAKLMSTAVVGGPTGLGIFVRPRANRVPILYHYGVNEGFRSVLAFAADASFGIALMTNGEGGRWLIPIFCDKLFRSNGQGPFPTL